MFLCIFTVVTTVYTFYMKKKMFFFPFMLYLNSSSTTNVFKSLEENVKCCILKTTGNSDIKSEINSFNHLQKYYIYFLTN